MFHSGKELESIYSTEGAFYQLEVAGQYYLCRSLATIRRRNTEARRANALLVLLNPGKCLPYPEEATIPVFHGKVDTHPVVRAIPDNTMHQLMRLMERMDWDWINVINLTDIRTGKFEAYMEIRRLMEQLGDSRHSVFSNDRQQELQYQAAQADVVIAGWGTKSAIVPAALEAFDILSGYANVRGLRYKKQPLYYHPFPWIRNKCVKWLDDMEDLLKQPAEVEGMKTFPRP